MSNEINRVILAIIKTPKDLTLQLNLGEEGVMKSVNGLLPLSWDYEATDRKIEPAEIRSLVLDATNGKLGILSNGSNLHDPGQVANDIGQSLIAAPVLDNIVFDLEAPDDQIQVAIADMTADKFKELDSTNKAMH